MVTDKKTDEKKEIERKKKHEVKRIATTFYKDLWKKRQVSKRTKDQMIAQITRKISDTDKRRLDREETKEEMKKVVKMMKKGKATGIDGIPMEFYQKFDFAVDWLHEIYGEMKTKRQMTETMRTSVIKLLFKKKDKRRIENYRPLSLLTADYKIIAKMMTERMKTVLKYVIGTEQQGFIFDGDILSSLLLVKQMIESATTKRSKQC